MPGSADLTSVFRREAALSLEFPEPTRPRPSPRDGGVDELSVGSSPAEPNRFRSTQRLLILPCLNEEEGLQATLAEIAKIPFRSPGAPPSILVVDGHSTDGTAKVAERWDLPMLTQRTRGKGAAVREGLAWAAEHGFTSVAVMDADGTYAAAALPAMFDLLDLGRELVVGVRRVSRSPHTTVRDMVHRVGNGLLNFAAGQVSGHPVLDICSGFWGLRTSAVGDLSLESDGFDIEAEVFVKAFRAHLHVSQIPVPYRDRVGDAKLHAVRDGARILLSIFRNSLRPLRAAKSRRPTPTRSPLPSLNSVLLALGPEHIVLLTAPERVREADGVARRLAAAAPQASVATAVVPSTISSLSDYSVLPGLSELPAPAGPTVVVALPAPSQVPGSPESLLVGIPRTGRILHLSSVHAASSAPSAIDSTIAEAYRRERLPKGRRAAWYILGSSLEPTWTRRELAMLGANVNGSPVLIYRRLPSKVARSRRGLPVPALPVVRASRV